jgi:hypothetical protein
MKKLRIWICLLLAGWFFWTGPGRCAAQTPALSLKDSLPVAEKALQDASIKAGDYYLYSVTYANSSKGNYWSYTWRPQTPSESNQVYVKVYMDKTVEVRGGNQKA